MNKQIAIQDLGFKDYKETWDYQELLLQKTLKVKIQNRREGRTQKTPNHFLFVEHPHVYSLGKSGEIENRLVN